MRFKKLITCSLMLYGSCCLAGGNPVFDAQNFARAFEILKEAKQHTEQARFIK